MGAVLFEGGDGFMNDRCLELTRSVKSLKAKGGLCVKVFARQQIRTRVQSATSDEGYSEEMRYRGGRLLPGNWESISKRVGPEEVEAFSELSGDKNPIHVDETFAKTTIFKRRVAHGMLGAALISAVAGMKMPGKGSIYVNQTLRFREPVYVGDTLTARCTVLRVNSSKRLVEMKTDVYNQEDSAVIQGQATVLYPEDLHASLAPN